MRKLLYACYTIKKPPNKRLMRVAYNFLSTQEGRRSRIKQLASTGNKSAKIVQVLHNEPERFYSVTQIGITLVSLALGAIGMVTLTQIMDPGIEAAFASLIGDGPKVEGWAHTFS